MTDDPLRAAVNSYTTTVRSAKASSRDERVDRLTAAVEDVCDVAAIEVEVRELDPGPGGWQRNGETSPLRRLVRAMDGAGLFCEPESDDDPMVVHGSISLERADGNGELHATCKCGVSATFTDPGADAHLQAREWWEQHQREAT